METHVKVFAVLQILMGALALVGAVVLMFVFVGSAGAVAASHDPDASVALPIIGITGFALVGFLLVMSLPGIVTGVGLLKLRPWARIAGIVLSILGLIAFPFGTVVGVYGLWVLFSKETERLFVAQPQTL
jgi:Ca2+/Na+ antiporter